MIKNFEKFSINFVNIAAKFYKIFLNEIFRKVKENFRKIENYGKIMRKNRSSFKLKNFGNVILKFQ